MKEAFVGAFTPAVRTFAQYMAGSLGALSIASLSDFANMGQLVVVLLWGALLTTGVTFFQNFAENLSYINGNKASA